MKHWLKETPFTKGFQNQMDGSNLKLLKNRLGGQEGKILKFSIDYTTLRVTDSEVNENVASKATNSLQDDLNNL